jgi:hypothetical protein
VGREGPDHEEDGVADICEAPEIDGGPLVGLPTSLVVGVRGDVRPPVDDGRVVVRRDRASVRAVAESAPEAADARELRL